MTVDGTCRRIEIIKMMIAAVGLHHGVVAVSFLNFMAYGSSLRQINWESLKGDAANWRGRWGGVFRRGGRGPPD